MTVPPAAFYALVWFALLAAVGAWYWLGKLVHANDEIQTLKRIQAHNNEVQYRTLKYCYEEVCNRAMLRHIDLPLMSPALRQRVQAVYLDNPALTGYDFPIEELPGHLPGDGLMPWRWSLPKHEMPPAVLAHLWLAGVI